LSCLFVFSDTAKRDFSCFLTRRGGITPPCHVFCVFRHGKEGCPSSSCPFILFDTARRVVPPQRVLPSSLTRRGGLSLLDVSFHLL
jgi:hypothetical protein